MTAIPEPEGAAPVGLPERRRVADGVRVFEFDPGTTMQDAVPVIRAALNDEGLTLAPETAHGKITSVTVGGRCLFRVPEFRIVSPEHDAQLREQIAQLQAQMRSWAGGAR